jgi:adenylate cyclase 9
MSAYVDNTITREDHRDVGCGYSGPGERDGSLETAIEESSDSTSSQSQDSGVGLALNFSESFRNSLGKPPPPSGLNFSHRRSSLQANSTPLCDLRRPSIVDMVNSGGIFINKRGSCEINLENVNANEIEQLYAEAQRRGSFSLNLNHSGKGAELEELCESKWMQQSSAKDSSEHLSMRSDTYKCLNTSRYWWSPNFNSEVLEKRLKKTVIEFLRRRFRVALVFLGLFTLLWIVVFSVNIPFSPIANITLSVEALNSDLAVYSVRYNSSYVYGGVVLFVCSALLLFITFTKYYARFAIFLSLLISVILMCCSYALAVSQIFSTEDVQGFLTLSFVAQFAITAVFILVLFTLSRLPIWLSVVLSAIYLIILEGVIGFSTYGKEKNSNSFPKEIYIGSAIGRIVLYIGLIFSGVTTSYLLQVRQLATFWKVAQCVLSQKALDLERELEEKTILSMMPKHFADGLLDVQVQLAFMIKQRAVQESQGSLGHLYQSISAPFDMRSMDNVSILFADIVDFTKFSSTLSAAELVGILNAVFSMFDEIVAKHNCEKISTLGDCYFCVSGCPEPEPKHADNCVNMGLAIIEALEDYRKRTQWPIQMRVGIHTGSVFCGVMGTKRFKFDVWSRDVRIANQIESASTPGRVLISQSTYSCLSEPHATELHTPQKCEPILSNMKLYYVSSEPKARPQNTGLSGTEWKKRINTIDTVFKTEDVSETTSSRRRESANSIRSTTTQLLCPWRREQKEDEEAPTKKTLEDQSSPSIMDIQTQLQRCTSYAELVVPIQGEEERYNIDIDKEIVTYMEEQNVNFDTYFDPQLNLLTLNFNDRDWESTYRNYGRDLDDGSNGELTEMELGYRITKLSYLLDTLALFVNFLVIMIGSAVCLQSDGTFYRIWHAWLGIFVAGLFIEVTVLVFVFAVFSPRWFPKWFASRATIIINWYVRSLVALFFIYYPMAIVGVSISSSQCETSDIYRSQLARLAHVQMTFFVTMVVLVSSITFMEISHIVKFVGGFLSAIFAVVIVLVLNLTLCIDQIASMSTSPPTTVPVTIFLGGVTRPPPEFEDGITRATLPTLPLSNYFMTYYSRHVAPEVVILLLLILIVLAVVNRMSEVSARLSFIGRIEASARRRYTRQRKVQAEWLLFNIIPQHVAYKLRTTGTFSQNHECVGVMFASIVNFQQFLHNDENKGEDSLRLLNIIISEFDTLLERDRFASVEKIKTIGSTYMAASGLNIAQDQGTVTHLLDLIEFGHQLVETLKTLNTKNDKFKGFVFEMQIGFNCGPVTSGVVGSRKMLYDIWGDTVNVASRMASTGAINEIQMPAACLKELKAHVKTRTVHKVVDIKGKGVMETVFILPPVPVSFTSAPPSQFS